MNKTTISNIRKLSPVQLADVDCSRRWIGESGKENKKEGSTLDEIKQTWMFEQVPNALSGAYGEEYSTIIPMVKTSKSEEIH